jgi:hypothetical protein
VDEYITSDEMVEELRAHCLEKGAKSQAEMGKLYGITSQAISLMLKVTDDGRRTALVPNSDILDDLLLEKVKFTTVLYKRFVWENESESD